MLTSATIFALATPPGKSGVAVFRISGAEAIKVAAKLGITNLTPRRAMLVDIKNLLKSETIDKALAIFFPAPNSFTGEDVIELHTHGSRAVINLLTKTLLSLPEIRLAEPGEFSRRALLNGKMDLAETEGLADLINAETEMQHKQALRQMTGVMSNLYEGWRQSIISTLAHLEAYIDFPDEDIPPSVRQEFITRAGNLKKSIDDYLNDNRRGELLREGVYAAIIGAPNVGKSSLMNYLAKRDVAIVSSVAGTTRDVIEVNLDIEGYPVTIADTAGIRESADAIEMEGIRRARERASAADLRIIMLDANDCPDFPAETLDMIDENSIILLNKAENNAIPKHLNIKNKPAVPVSVTTGKGLDEFILVLKNELESRMNVGANPSITRERHRKALEETSQNLSIFLTGAEKNTEIELLAENLRRSAVALGSITGKIEVDDILDSLFKTFCIGK